MEDGTTSGEREGDGLDVSILAGHNRAMDLGYADSGDRSAALSGVPRSTVQELGAARVYEAHRLTPEQLRRDRRR